jgi:hypothetical protein
MPGYRRSILPKKRIIAQEKNEVLTLLGTAASAEASAGRYLRSTTGAELGFWRGYWRR